MTISNDSAFGFVDNRSGSYEDNEVHYGLTKREYFAAMAMQGLCIPTAWDKKFQQKAEDLGSNSSIVIATYAVDLADALINELNKTDKP